MSVSVFELMRRFAVVLAALFGIGCGLHPSQDVRFEVSESGKLGMHAYAFVSVADGDGIHREKKIDFKATLPQVHFELATVPATPADDARFCLIGDDLRDAPAGVAFEIDVDGDLLTVRLENAEKKTCVLVNPTKKGTFHGVARLVTPYRELARFEMPVHDLTEPFTLNVTDEACGTPYAFVSFPGPTYAGVRVKVTATFADGR